MEELMNFTMLKSKLYLKLAKEDATYIEELTQILSLMPNTERYTQELRGLLIGLTRQRGEWAETAILDVASQTACISKELLIINRKLANLDRKSPEEQATIIRGIMTTPFPQDATINDITSFYSECANLAISSHNNKLLEELILKMEELSNG